MRIKCLLLIISLVVLVACSGENVPQSSITGSVVIDTTGLNDDEPETSAPAAAPAPAAEVSTDPCVAVGQKEKEFNSLNDQLNNNKKEMLSKLDTLENAVDEGQKAALNKAVDDLLAANNQIKPQMQLIQKQIDALKAKCG
ncbi:MAG: hypothetical protein QF632_04610 [Candidatus Woesearchaeota archaeon]|jgi:hypothetical protein|nr:hypothetical protein [Candidatus Woesearchaeota archaeon]MDP7324014.1 hypothetical protein [Candidatus Woesearchaeota archaeon]MDP7457482.1 hypothetical protein [Candidatus Woesearchaeota archaeon]|tara:strand:+ start:239 stop:661 length:423 start_codon:yes stop_codon:yes gene_type:complete